MDGRTDGWIERTDRTDGPIRQTDRMDGWTKRMDQTGGLNGWMDRWTDIRLLLYTYHYEHSQCKN